MRIAPKSADYGYYVDNYKKNGESGVKDTIDNPANAVLSEMLDYFTLGTSWDNETIDNVTYNNSPETGDTSSAVMAFVAFALSLTGLLTASFADKKMIDKIR